jgi:methylenetetrahydrofolate reductase (NADPH)
MNSLFKDNKTIFSLEVFPPKDEIGINEIFSSMQSFANLKPDYISVTYGAAGSVIDNKNGKSMTTNIAAKIQNDFNITSVAHLTCVNHDKESVRKMLNEFKDSGIKYILALRGDLKKDAIPSNDFKYATDLIKFINEFGGFEVCAACYPEGHVDSSNFKKDLEVLKIKADLKIHHFISQLFFDNEDFYKLMEYADILGIKTPIEAGIMPAINAKSIMRMVSLSGAKLPTKLTKIISRFENNPVALRQAGLNYAVEQITDLITNGVRGIHLYTMNNPSIAEYIKTNIGSVLEGINGENN